MDRLPYVNGGTICTPVNYSGVCDLNPGPKEWQMCIVSALTTRPSRPVISWLLGGIFMAAFIVQNVMKKEKEMLYVVNLN